jgi:hypothetical protein
LINDSQVSANLLSGHFGSEVGLIADTAERSGSVVVGGTENLPGQAVLYALAQDPLIGEEVFAGGAYLGAGAVHNASLRMQDIVRWLVVTLIIIGAILKITGLDQVLLGIVEGIKP